MFDAPVLAVGQSIPFRRGGRVALPVDVSRTLEDLLDHAPFDFVHVHEPFAPSAASAALRHSRALNVGSFHSATERLLSTQVARPIVERLFGRLDGRTASFAATRDLVERFFPGHYEVIPPGADLVERRAAATATARDPLLRRGGARRAAGVPARAPPAAARPPLARHDLVARPGRRGPGLARAASCASACAWPGPPTAARPSMLAAADVVVLASSGSAPAPQLVLRAIGAGAVPVAARLPQYEECVRDGELGLLFEPRDTLTLAAQLERLVSRTEPPATRVRGRVERVAPGARLGAGGRPRRGALRALAARRHDSNGKPAVRKRLRERPYIHVDLHMHTDHSHDCATPVETLLDAAKEAGLGAIAVTDHNEISGAHEAREQADGIKVIVAEEVKTADQGEVIGLFIEDKIQRGLTLQETIAEIRRQGGLVYVPHPFDRMHSVPDYEHLLDVVEDIDAIEVFNPRVAFSAFNEEAARFAAKYRIVAGAGSDSHVAAGPRLGEDPDARLRRARGVPRVAARRRHHPQEAVAALRAGAQVHPDQGHAGAARRRTAGPGPAPSGRRATSDAGKRRAGGAVQRHSPDARHRRRDPREVPRAGDQGAEHPHARDPDLRALPARQPDAGARARATRRPTSSCSSSRRCPRRSRRAWPSTAGPAAR